MASLIRDPKGFSVLEALVATLLVISAMALAAGLIVDAQTRLAHSGRRNLDLTVDLAFDQLRSDLRASAGVSGTPLLDPLRIVGHVSGDTIDWQLEGRDLVRRVYSDGGATLVGERTALRNVFSFRWSPRPDTVRQVVQVEVDYGEAPAEARGRVRADELVRRSASVVVAPRNIGGVPYW